MWTLQKTPKPWRHCAAGAGRLGRMPFARRLKQGLVGPARIEHGTGRSPSDAAHARLIGRVPAGEALPEAAARLRRGGFVLAARWMAGKDAPSPVQVLAHQPMPAGLVRLEAGRGLRACSTPGLCPIQFVKALLLARPGKQRRCLPSRPGK